MSKTIEKLHNYRSTLIFFTKKNETTIGRNFILCCWAFNAIMISETYLCHSTSCTPDYKCSNKPTIIMGHFRCIATMKARCPSLCCQWLLWVPAGNEPGLLDQSCALTTMLHLLVLWRQTVICQKFSTGTVQKYNK